MTRHLRGMPRRWRQRRWRHENHHGIPPNKCRQAVQRLGSTSATVRVNPANAQLRTISTGVIAFEASLDGRATCLTLKPQSKLFADDAIDDRGGGLPTTVELRFAFCNFLNSGDELRTQIGMIFQSEGLTDDPNDPDPDTGQGKLTSATNAFFAGTQELQVIADQANPANSTVLGQAAGGRLQITA